ncbi:MAG: hypothetical protein QOJ64_4386 [Acidobacteriota bacterium]|jgi:TonB family protein|nr:hypothetical protein [Acidobacteriota bacterium]
MSSEPFINDQLVFGELLAYLRQHGFSIGLDHYLRLQQLLSKIRGHCVPRELRTLLCPIFATSKLQQENFYRAFDSYFNLFQVSAGEEGFSESSTASAHEHSLHFKASTSRRRWLYAVAPLGFAVLLLLAFLFFRPPPSQKSSNESTSNANVDAGSESPSEIAGSETTSPSPRVEPTENEVRPNEVQLSTPTPAPSPTPTTGPTFYERNRSAIQLAIILAPLIFFLLYEWYRFVRRRLLLERQHSRRPPFVWPVKVDAPEEGLYDSEQFLTAARLLRRRQMDEFLRLDVEASVTATIERLGFPEFRYRTDSRVPEYLILIDRASYKDHQARFFEELTKALEREGVFVVRYFFDGDPRVCRDETGAGVVQLAELENKYADHRLLIFGDGNNLLDQITGRLDSWTAVFNHWQDRALLTVASPSQWGLREISLAQLFIVLPATLNGLLALVDYFETTVPADLRAWMQGSSGTSAVHDAPEELVAELRSTLGAETFEWLCACAVYTELQWNLTLFIGSLPSMPPGLLTEANLLKLIRLPWFRVGVMPDEVRWLLINRLVPTQQEEIRAALIALLEKDPAPTETFANDQYRLNLSTQRWLQSRTRKRLRELLQTIKQLPRNQVLRDLTLVRFLEGSRRSPLDFLLPDRLRKLFYHRGVSAFGMKTGARFLFTLVLVGAAWIGIRAVSPKTTPETLHAELAKLTPWPIPTRDTSSPPPQDSSPTPQGPLPAGDPNILTTSTPSPSSTATTNAPSGAVPNASQPSAGNSTNPRPSVSPAPLTSSGTIVGVTSVPGVVSEQTTGSPQGQNSGQVDDSKAAVTPGTEVGQPQPSAGASRPGGESTATTTPDPTPTSDAPVSVGSLNSRARSLPKPDYPSFAAAAQAYGTVIVQVILDETGKVTSAKAVSGHTLLREPAVKAAFRARFNPIIISGKPSRVIGIISYNFVMESRDPQRPGIQNRPDQRPPGRQPGGRNP